MSWASDYWYDLAEAEQVGVPADAPVVVRRVGTTYECTVNGVSVTSNTEDECWRKVRELRGDEGVCVSCGGHHFFAEDCRNDGHVPRPRMREEKGRAA